MDMEPDSLMRESISIGKQMQITRSPVIQQIPLPLLIDDLIQRPNGQCKHTTGPMGQVSLIDF